MADAMNTYDYYNTKLVANIIVSAMMRADADKMAKELLHRKDLKGWKLQGAYNEDGGEVTEPRTKAKPVR